LTEHNCLYCLRTAVHSSNIGKKKGGYQYGDT
jgi:hypothetical protein